MTRTTTASRKTTNAASNVAVGRRVRTRARGVVWSRVMPVTVVIYALLIGGFWYFEPLRKSFMSASKSEIEAKLEEVKKRERERQEREQLERERRRISEQDRDDLKDEAEKRPRREMIERIEDLAWQRQEMLRLRERNFEELEQRTALDLAEPMIQELERLARRVDAKGADVRQDHMEEARGAELADAARQARELASKLTERPLDAELADELEKLVEKQVFRPAEEDYQEIRKIEREQWTEEQNRTQRQTRELASRADELRRAAREYKETIDGLEMAAMNDPSAAGEPLEVDPPDPAEMAQLDPQQFYEEAAAIEQAIAEDYKAVRAAEMASLQGTSFEEAWGKVTDVPTAGESQAGSLPPLASIAQQVQTLADLDSYSEALRQTLAGVAAMQSNAQSMVQQARQLAGMEMPPGQAGAQQQGRRNLASAALLRGSRNRVVDLSGMMRAMSQPSWGSSNGGMQDGRNTGEWGIANVGYVETGGDFGRNSREVIANALPGRKFTRDSDRKGWLFIGTWYVIGPWKVNRAGDFEQVFPPEVRVDLDAEYEGMIDSETGEPYQLRWNFIQSGAIRIRPEPERGNGAYYAYTELYFEEPTDLFMAVGVDDAAKVWINDLLVWEDNYLSRWNLGESFRKIHFKQGFNRVLIRFENGPNVCYFSMLLCPPEALEVE